MEPGRQVAELPLESDLIQARGEKSDAGNRLRNLLARLKSRFFRIDSVAQRIQPNLIDFYV